LLHKSNGLTTQEFVHFNHSNKKNCNIFKEKSAVKIFIFLDFAELQRSLVYYVAMVTAGELGGGVSRAL
jgi:hypothetical protein